MPQPIGIAIASSVCTLLAVKLWKISYRLLPYLSRRLPLDLGPDKFILITGATDGIGKSFSQKMAKQGNNLIICGRNKDKIDSTIKQLQAQLQTNTPKFLPLVIDFSNASLSQINHKIQELKLTKQSIAGVINSCGISSFNPISEHSQKSLQNIRRVNIGPLQYFLTQASKESLFHQNLYYDNNKAIRLPFIVHISSLSSKFAVPYAAHYCGTKAYTSSLIDAYSNQKQTDHKFNTILNVEPWFVKTKMIGDKNSKGFIKPEVLVEESLRCLGKRKICKGSIKHQILSQFIESFYSYETTWTKKLMDKLIYEQNQQKISRYLKMKKIRQKREQKKRQ